ncbi:MAG: DUF1330 domain-containing protein [Anaerolineae bacterium]|jgi:uncharacterized protein (DUF1330 family)|nr:DUF1330 domain-containing protein [Anaerolineae bacterium]
MAVYVVVEADVQDAAGYAEYRQLSTAALAQYGGEFIVRGGQVTVLEGDWQPPRLVIARFASMEQARAWYDSPEYTAARALRQRYAVSNVIFVEGV